MKVIKCPKCGEDVEINIARSITDDGEVYMCPNCGYKIRYTER